MSFGHNFKLSQRDTTIFHFQFSIFNSQLSPTFVRRHCGSPRNYLHGCCYPSRRNHRSRNCCGCYCYRSDAFVYWLNRKVLRDGERAQVLEVGLGDWDRDLPAIFF